jgi:ABC-type nitrate/sulfonate/bicarbonate transport system substrate-binding protein
VLDGAPWAAQVGLFLGRERGFFGEAGVDVHFDVAPSREAALRSLAEGRADLALVGGFDLLRARSAGAPVVSIFALTVRPAQNGTPEHYELVVATGEHARRNQTDALRAFVAAAQRGYADAARAPNDAIDVLVRANPAIERAQAERSVGEIATLWRQGPIGEQTEPRWRQSAAWLAARGLARPELDIGAAFTNELLPRPAPTPVGGGAPAPAPSGPTPTPVPRPGGPAPGRLPTVIQIGP